MYVNQIDNIIDQTLDRLHFDGLSKDPTYNLIIGKNKTNYVEYRDKINAFIQKFVDGIDTNPIKELINNKENLDRIMSIVKRYVAYYYFLSIAYHYTGTIKDYINNLIQYSKLQENTTFNIRNFFDTENNSQLIHYYKIIKDCINLLLMSDLQRKTVDKTHYIDAINFLNNLGKEYTENYLLMVRQNDRGQVMENEISVNSHNLIKTIVFGEIYRNQEQTIVYNILNDAEEDKFEYQYIDIIVENDDTSDLDNFKQIFLGYDNAESLATSLYELVNASEKISTEKSLDTKNGNLLMMPFVSPIVDDFLRYHRDTEQVERDSNAPLPVNLSNSNAKNVQLALLYQQRKKKENTKAHLVVTKLDAITELYSENLNPEAKKEILRYFQGPLSSRKAVLHNYLEELKILSKILKQGRKTIENNEYFLELTQIINHAYFNFENFKEYGTNITLINETPINMIRYSNIENKEYQPRLYLDIRTGVFEELVNVVGMSIGPFNDDPIQCVKKESLLNIRNLEIKYIKNGKTVSYKSENGFNMYNKIMKHFIINTIDIEQSNPLQEFTLKNYFEEIRKLNPEIANKIIYWIFDHEKDEFKTDTFELTGSQNYRGIIKQMNSVIYDKTMNLLYRHLEKLINKYSDWKKSKIELLIRMYNDHNRLSLSQNEQDDLITKNYLKIKTKFESTIYQPKPDEMIQMPKYIPTYDNEIYKIKIDMSDPLDIREYTDLKEYANRSIDNKTISGLDLRCKHENEWNELRHLMKVNLNKYNEAATKFMDIYALETTELDFVCKICGQVLPVKQFVQDGTFDNNTQKFITAYVPLDIPLQEMNEYKKYPNIISYIDGKISQLSLITNTNMLVGNTAPVRQKRKGLVKNIIDIILKHSYINIRKNQSEDIRQDFFKKKFNIDVKLDIVYFFELSDNILENSQYVTDTEISIRNLKRNNVLLYLIMMFITELNGTQIAMMFFNKIANIYTYLKYSSKLFGDILIRKNITDMETAPIIQYPVLCYLIYILSYYFIKYKLWHTEKENNKVYDPYYSKIIINSFVDLFNSISMDAGKHLDDYVYSLTVNKLYTQLNTVFKNNDIIDILKKNHINFADRTGISELPVHITDDFAKTPFLVGVDVVSKPSTTKLLSMKISNGVEFFTEEILYPKVETFTDLTNCPVGSSHLWKAVDKDIICQICGEKNTEVHGNVDRTDAVYYYELNVIANRRCLSGSIHDFVEKDGKVVCAICSEGKDKQYTKKELDMLEENINKIEDVTINKLLEGIASVKTKEEREESLQEELINNLNTSYTKAVSGKIYGQYVSFVEKFVDKLENILGANTNLEDKKYPIYLKDDVYIIDHLYDGTVLVEPIIFLQKNNRILFREAHPFFKSDVYYYTDNKTQTDVFYQAITLNMIGYKQKHKDFVSVNNSNNYLKIIPSIQNRILIIGYKTKYIDITDKFDKNKLIYKDANENYFNILDNLIRDRILKIKSIVDKFSSIISKVRNFETSINVEDAEAQERIASLKIAETMDKIVNKYGKSIKASDFKEDQRIFDDWNILRNKLVYQQVDWMGTIMRPGSMYINSENINYYDTTSSLIIYYLLNRLDKLLESSEKNTKITFAQMLVDIILYIYNLYNIDDFKNNPDIKRFNFILNGSNVLMDLLRQGQGLPKAKELDAIFSAEPDLEDITEDILTADQQEELEDLKEEAEALDVEGDYYAEEDEDYGGDAGDE